MRRLEVALGEFARVVDADDQRALARELGRLMKRLGDVRDLDVLLEALSDGSDNAIEPLRKAWQRDRRRAEKQLRRELAGRRFRRFRTALHRVAGPGVPSASSRAGLDAQHPPRRLGPDAAVHVLDSLADVLAYSIDPVRSDVRAIHGLRISAKQLRDTLRGYEDVFGPESRRLADRVGELQDVAGALHDADVAARRARRFLRRHGLATDAMVAIRAFAADQDDRVSRQRATLVGHVADIRGDAFRMRAAALVTDGIRAHRPAGDGIG